MKIFQQKLSKEPLSLFELHVKKESDKLLALSLTVLAEFFNLRTLFQYFLFAFHVTKTTMINFVCTHCYMLRLFSTPTCNI